MSIWNDLFEIYQSVQNDERVPSDEKNDFRGSVPPTSVGQAGDDQAAPTVYVFAYVDDGKGNITRNIAVEDRITMLELKNQELEHRYNLLLEQLNEQDDEQFDN